MDSQKTICLRELKNHKNRKQQSNLGLADRFELLFLKFFKKYICLNICLFNCVLRPAKKNLQQLEAGASRQRCIFEVYWSSDFLRLFFFVRKRFV